MNKKLTNMETVFKALADSTRLRILGLLMTGEVCVCHIHESLRISQPKASRHLAYLRKAGLVETRRDGLWIHYRMAVVADTVLSTVQQTVTHALRHMDVIRRDVERLQRATGCCLPPDGDTRTYTCCAGVSAPTNSGTTAATPVKSPPQPRIDEHVPQMGSRNAGATVTRSSPSRLIGAEH